MSVLVDSHQIIERHFHEHRTKIIKRLTYQAKTKEAAEDILQEAYYRALKYFRSYDGRDFSHWFNRIVHSCFVDHLHAERGYSQEEADAEEEAIDCPCFPQHIMKEIFELIDTKSVVQIEVLSLYFKNEYSAKDIAAITEYSYAQCHKIISRFREELRQLYQ